MLLQYIFLPIVKNNNDLGNIVKINEQTLENKYIAPDNAISWDINCETISGYKPIGIIGWNCSFENYFDEIDVYALQIIDGKINFHCKNVSTTKGINKQPIVFVLYIKSNLL